MHRQLSRAMTTLKEHGSVSLAKMATMGGFCDLYCIITKATSPDDAPLSDRYINQILKIFSLSPSSSFRSFSLGFSRRFMKTRCWRVALKCLILLHHLLWSLPENSSFRGEIIWARTKGLLRLNPSLFVDSSSSSFSEDYALFIRSYASLLDEALDCYSIYGKETNGREGEGEILQETLAEKMKEIGRLIEFLPQLQSLMDRVLDCQPTPVATANNLVRAALKLVIRDSLICYASFQRELLIMIDSLRQLPYGSFISAFNIYKKAVIQINQLSKFYNWCKHMGIFCEIYKYPSIDRIPEIQVITVEKLVNGIWEFSESSSPSTRSPLMGSCESLIEDEREKNATCLETIVSTVWEKFEEDFSFKELERVDEMEPLIKFDEAGDNANWEAILDASLPPSYQCHGHNYEYIHDGQKNSDAQFFEVTNERQMQVYKSNLGSNLLCHGHNISQHCGALPINHANPWGL